MPGSSVSACHLCHLHSHNHDNLVRTSPLRHSRGRSKHSKYSSSSSGGHRHHHGHSNSGYNSRDEAGERVGRSNSSSALARLTDHSHSLPGSRSNSLSRYNREVSTLPDGGDTYKGRVMRPTNSTRSLDLNPPLTSLLDTRTTSLPRVSTALHSHPQINAQPDILVNAMPRSRANSRSGSLPRNPVALSQDNSHDYYLDMHRQRFKEDKRKHRFNLQTVMLIGCYTLLVMIAIVVGVVLCYQNGWFGLGPPQEKISGDRPTNYDSNAIGRDSTDMKNRRMPPDKNANLAESDVRNHPRNPDFDNPSVNNNKYLHGAGLLPIIVQHQNPQGNEEMDNQRNHPRHVTSQNANHNTVQGKSPMGSNSHRNIPNGSHSDNRGQFNPQLQNTNHRNIANHGNSPNDRQGNIPLDSMGNPSRPSPTPQDPRVNQGTMKKQSPGRWPNQSQLPTQGVQQPTNLAPGHALQPNNQHPGHATQANNQHPSHTHHPANQHPNHTPQPNNQHPGHTPQLNNQHPNHTPQPNNQHPGHTPQLNNQHPNHTPQPNNQHAGHTPQLNNQHPSHTHQRNNQHLSHTPHPNNQHTSHSHLPSNLAPSHANRPINPARAQHPTINRPITNSNSPTGIPLPSTNPDLTFNPGFNSNLNPNQNRNQKHSKPVDTAPPLRQGSIDANAIAKTLLQENLHTPHGQRPSSLSSNSNTNQHIPLLTKNFNNGRPAISANGDSLASSFADKIMTGDTNTFTTQELLDLLAIRRMRDLLNSEGNTKTILDLLRNVEPSANTRLEKVREEKLTPSDFQDGFEGNQATSRGSGRNIKDSVSAHPNNFKIRELIEALGGHTGLSQSEKSVTHRLEDSGNLKNDEEIHQGNLKQFINRTINGALIRLINSRVDQFKKGNIDPDVSFNVSGISVFPVNSEDLKVLLSSSPASVQENLGNLSKERLRSLQILQRLIEMNDRKQTVERHVDSGNPVSQNTGDKITPEVNSPRRANSQEIRKSNVSPIGGPIPAARIGDRPNSRATNVVKTSSGRFPPQDSSGVRVRNVTSTFNRGETALRNAAATQLSSKSSRSSSRRRPPTGAPDPSFALMVRTDGLGNAPRDDKPVFPPPFISARKRNSRARTRSVATQAPIKERVAVRPGRRRGRSQSAIVRAWTHMDSKGTLSKGQVHSDGSFTFTNCRPADVCDQDKDLKTAAEEAKNN